MTLSWTAYRSVCTRAVAAAVIALFGAGCAGTEPATRLPRDLMRDLPGARIQPAATAEVAQLGEVADAGVTVPALITAAPARLTWPVRLGEHADVEASVALMPGEAAPAGGVIVRIGIADDRSYEELFRLPLAGGPQAGSLVWHPIRIDLGAYSGWKFSLFYRPSRITWNLIVAADPTPGGSVAWRALAIRPH